jgi:nucleoside 2-deoxyribosyltransferase
MKLYIANALFSQADYLFNEVLAYKITKLGHEIYLPQRNTAINDKSKSADSIAIFQGDTEKLEWADAIVAVLDGPVIDPGVAAEIGYMAAKGKRIYGLLTDSRENSRTVNSGKIDLLSNVAESQFPYLNLYVVGAVKSFGNIYSSTEQLIEALE